MSYNNKLKRIFIVCFSLVLLLIGIYIYIYQYKQLTHRVLTHSGLDVYSSMVIRSAYIDKRVKDGHKHSVVIFAEVSMELRKYGLIEGCGAGADTIAINAKAFKITPLYFLWINENYPKLTHEEIMIDCYDLELHENNTVFLRYRPLPNSNILITSAVNVTYTVRGGDYKDKVVVCTTCFGKPYWLSEWLKYQKTIGVDLVQLYVEEQFMSDNENLKIIESYIQEGFVKVENRKTYFNTSQIYYHSQLLNYNDCLYRHQEVFEYAFFLDNDDFFIPRLPNKTNIHHYINQFFPKDNQASVEFKWRKYYPAADCGLTQPLSSLKDGNVTRLLKVKEFWAATEAKFVCRPTLTTMVGIHTTGRELERTTTVRALINVAYVINAPILSNTDCKI